MVEFYNPASDLFAEETKISDKIHIRLQKRNARKCITIVEGLLLHISQDDAKSFIKYINKKHCCGGVFKKKDGVAQFQGDQRYNVRDILIKKCSISKDNIKIHGV